MKREIIDTGKVIWQSDRAKTALCPHCFMSIKTQYEGDGVIFLTKCCGPFGVHVVEYYEHPDGKKVVLSETTDSTTEGQK